MQTTCGFVSTALYKISYIPESLELLIWPTELKKKKKILSAKDFYINVVIEDTCLLLLPTKQNLMEARRRRCVFVSLW